MTLRLLDKMTCQQLENAGFGFIKYLSSINYDNKKCFLYEPVTAITGVDTSRYYPLTEDTVRKLQDGKNKELYICY